MGWERRAVRRSGRLVSFEMGRRGRLSFTDFWNSYGEDAGEGEEGKEGFE